MKKLFLAAIAFLAFQVAGFSQVKGDKVTVLWNGQWYPATVLEVGKTTWKIHYDGYGAEWDEWVGSDRIKVSYKKGDWIQVLWNKSWYKAQILDVNGSKYKIHYDGYGAEWDEWVTTDRMKK